MLQPWVKTFCGAVARATRIGVVFTPGRINLIYCRIYKGDWMPPFGEGEHADIEFKVLPRENFGIGKGPSGRPKPYFRDTISVVFVGEGNGIVKEEPLPNAVLKVRTAPENGYQQSLRIWSGLTKTMEMTIARTRTHAMLFAFGRLGRSMGGSSIPIMGRYMVILP